MYNMRPLNSPAHYFARLGRSKSTRRPIFGDIIISIHGWDGKHEIRPSPSENTLPVVIKICMGDYVPDTYAMQIVMTIRIRNFAVKSALQCTVWSQCTPVPSRQTNRQTDGQTDEHHGNSATIRWTHRALKHMIAARPDIDRHRHCLLGITLATPVVGIISQFLGGTLHGRISAEKK